VSRVLVPVRRPLSLQASVVTVYLDDVIFPAYPIGILTAERAGCVRAIELCDRDLAIVAKRKTTKEAQLEKADEESSFGKTLAKAIGKCDTDTSKLTADKNKARTRIGEIDEILNHLIDANVTLTVYLNGVVLTTKTYVNLPRTHRVDRLEVEKAFTIPETSTITLRATLTGRWKNDDLSRVIFVRFLAAEHARVSALHQRISDLTADVDAPESEFDDDYMDGMADALPELAALSELDKAINTQLSPPVTLSEIALKTLDWTNEAGASVINGRAFRLQVRTEITHEVLLSEALALRSHSLEESSTNTLRTVETKFIYMASHFGDKHALAGTLALYKRYAAVLADEPSKEAAQDDMTWYLETTGGRIVPRIRAALSIIESRIAPCLTGPGSATRLMANAFRKLGAAETVAELRKSWLKETSPGRYREDAADHRGEVQRWLLGNGLDIPPAHSVRLLDHKQPKVLLWMRGRPFKTEGNPSPQLILQLAQELKKRALIPLIVGEMFPLSEQQQEETGAIDFTEHWKSEVFRCPSNHLRQVYMLDLLALNAGLVGVIGGKSGSLEGTAMLGINTLWFCNGAPPYYEPRLYQWDMIPWYREISVAGFVATQRVREGTEHNPQFEAVPYEQQRIGRIEGASLAILQACLDEIAKVKKNALDLRSVIPVQAVVVHNY
jgi:hypothetical protein